MVAITITAANVLAGSNASVKNGTAGATITQGQSVYFDPITSTFKLTVSNSGTAAARSPAGIALNGASLGQPLAVQYIGDIAVGGAMTAGVAYYVGRTAGSIVPVADLVTGDYPAIVGLAKSTTVLGMDLFEAGVAL